jgi:hypothetical protein
MSHKKVVLIGGMGEGLGSAWTHELELRPYLEKF